ncbi:UDP-3-O-(3-hydroxymyristoyl)glucosamine N-acyltransferase [Chachezhania sediminis]|uniref:UDP-3-O-(3-hydroxymyristoyl)glucosamine N-acyltransferase n=1 Tax=Chachezhania sediminis TaxID=2599291 RepID=UPI00131DB270|nr:UDP-3-O-(3-hydroxymyristoyl)glucosamine N-acyltransferase [Chachezhania sediminis]
MEFSIGALAQSLGLKADGDLDLTILAASEPADAGPDDLAVAMSPKYAGDLGKGQARAAILWDGADWKAMGLSAAIFAPRPRLAMSGLTRQMDLGQGYAAGIHPSAVVDPAAVIGEGVSIGPMSVVMAGARIGDGTVLGPQTFVGMNATLGQNCFLREHASIGARVTVGDRVILQPGARLGGDGFSYVTPEVSAVENVRHTLGDAGDAKAQAWVRIHSLGSVRIGNDVEIGANATIDNGTIRDTTVGDGTKIDNLVTLGHNVIVGKDCLLCGQVGIAGSTHIGNNVVMGGQAGSTDNIFIGDNAVIGGKAGLLTNVPAGRVMMGYPAVKMELHTEIYKAQRRLPRLLKDVADLKKAVFNGDPNG